jgi:hypothetical protein
MSVSSVGTSVQKVSCLSASAELCSSALEEAADDEPEDEDEEEEALDSGSSEDEQPARTRGATARGRRTARSL